MLLQFAQNVGKNKIGRKGKRNNELVYDHRLEKLHMENMYLGRTLHHNDIRGRLAIRPINNWDTKTALLFLDGTGL